jgi:hypothetical protein
MTDPKEVEELSDDEYNATYAEGSGGHVLPPEVLEKLNKDEAADD